LKAIRIKNDEYTLYKIRSSILVKLNKYNDALIDCQKMIQLKTFDGEVCYHGFYLFLFIV